MPTRTGGVPEGWVIRTRVADANVPGRSQSESEPLAARRVAPLDVTIDSSDRVPFETAAEGADTLPLRSTDLTR
jgi:hypothetical protein